MKTPGLVHWNSVASETLMPGLERKFVNTANCTIARFFLKQGVVVAEHQHANEQIALVISGALKFRLQGEEVVVRAGEFLCIPPGVPHSAEAMEDTVDIDVFSPPRADWASGDDAYLRK
jgi:quercetin dioxygenase-like cupin family protein